jgi:hypothetical protein
VVPRLVCLDEIGNGSNANAHDRFEWQRSELWFAAGPESKLTTSRVTQQHDPIQVNESSAGVRVVLNFLVQPKDLSIQSLQSKENIVPSLRPTTFVLGTLSLHSSIFDDAYSDTSGHKELREVVDATVCHRIFGLPEAAMQNDNERE